MAVNKPSYPLEPPSVFQSSHWREFMEVKPKRDAKTLEEQQSEVSTPVAETPVESVHLHSQFQGTSSATSPSLATASSPTSSAVAHSLESGLNDVCTSTFFVFIFVTH